MCVYPCGICVGYARMINGLRMDDVLNYVWMMCTCMYACMTNELCRIVHGLWMDHVRHMHGLCVELCGLCMEYAWIMHGLCIDYVWIMHGFSSVYSTCMDHLQDMHGLSMELYGICTEYGWIMYGLRTFALIVPRSCVELYGLWMECMDYVWIMLGLCMDYAWIMHGLCTAYAWIMHGLCTDCACILHDNAWMYSICTE